MARAPVSLRAARVSAGRLLIEERKTVTSIRQDIRALSALAVADAVRLEADGQDADARRAALLAIILAGSNRMATKLQRTIQDRRQATREQAVQRVRVELKTASVQIDITSGVQARLAEDAMHAQSAADALAAAWRANAIAAALEAGRSDESQAAAIAAAGDSMDGRALRTGATEGAQAYSDEHRRVLEDLADDEGISQTLAAARIVRQWSAILDRRTCSDCADHDGEVSAIGGAFDGGDEPGFVHPLCRCIDLVTALPADIAIPIAA